MNFIEFLIFALFATKTVFSVQGFANGNLDLRVLVLGSTGSGNLNSVKESLDGFEIPYTVVTVPSTGLVEDLILYGVDGRGLYSSIVFSDGRLEYPDSEGKYYSVLTSSQWLDIEAYESKFAVRRVMLNHTPGSDVDTVISPFDSTCYFSAEKYALFNTTLMKELGLTQVNINMKAAIPQGIYTLPALIKNPSSASYQTRALLYVEIEDTDCVMAPTPIAVLTRVNNTKEIMAFSMAFGSWSILSAALNHVWIPWVTRNVHLGVRRVYFSTQVDDLFLASDQWNTGIDVDTNKPTGEVFRISEDDLREHADWQKDLNDYLPDGSEFVTEFAFNFNGVLEQAVVSPMEYSCADEIDPPNDTFKKVMGTGSVCWPSSVQASNITVKKYNSKLRNGDHLYDAARDLRHEFYWLSHTFTHLALNNASASDIRNELLSNIAFSQGAYLNIQPKQFSATSIVLPRISGLHNGDVIAELKRAGYTNTVGDTSRATITNSADQIHVTWQTTVESSNVAGFDVIPRFPTEIYFLSSTIEQNVAVYNIFYEGLLGESNFDQLLEREASRVVAAMLKLNKAPHMFHQGNLRFADTDPKYSPLTQSTRGSLLTMWIETMLDHFLSLIRVPIVTLKQEKLYQKYVERRDRHSCNATLSTQLSNSKITGLILNVQNPPCIYAITVTQKLVPTQFLKKNQLLNDLLVYSVNATANQHLLNFVNPLAWN